MPVPLIPMPFEQLGRRSFSFFPAIVGIEHNQWVLRRVTWTEVDVLNTKTSQELMIPRRFIGEVSAAREPFLIVGLIKELEYKEGAVWPHQRRILEMPRAVNGTPTMRRMPAARPAPVIGIRLEPEKQTLAWRRIAACVAVVLMLIAAGILACFQAVESHFRGGRDVRTVGRNPAQGFHSH